MLIYQVGTSFIVGSMHLLPAAWSETTIGVVSQLVDKTSITIVEADTASFSEPNFARFKSGVLLSSTASAGLYQAAIQAGEHFGIEEADLACCKPWWAAMRVVSHALVELGFVPTHGVDTVARQSTEATGHRIGFLEAPHRGLKCFDTAPPEEQLLSLEFATRRRAEGVQMFSNVVAAWASGSEKELAKVLDRHLQLQPTTFQCAIERRNLEWLPKVRQALEAGSALVVVGALHLVSRSGLVALLRTQGFEIKG